ncbi:MAG: hypothetical protein KGI75_24790 [Rhizobiaceae bacterium]|nr:hypothetical protein [Rhizobiaceae bacterium]
MWRSVLTSRLAFWIEAILVAALTYNLWLFFTADSRLAPDVLEKAEKNGKIAVNVELPFPPERFHILKIQASGSVSGVSKNVIHVRSIDAANIRKLAETYFWIGKISADNS